MICSLPSAGCTTRSCIPLACSSVFLILVILVQRGRGGGLTGALGRHGWPKRLRHQGRRPVHARSRSSWRPSGFCCRWPPSRCSNQPSPLAWHGRAARQRSSEPAEATDPGPTTPGGPRPGTRRQRPRQPTPAAPPARQATAARHPPARRTPTPAPAAHAAVQPTPAPTHARIAASRRSH